MSFTRKLKISARAGAIINARRHGPWNFHLRHGGRNNPWLSDLVPVMEKHPDPVGHTVNQAYAASRELLDLYSEGHGQELFTEREAINDTIDNLLRLRAFVGSTYQEAAE
jgi:hypothetical protein